AHPERRERGIDEEDQQQDERRRQEQQDGAPAGALVPHPARLRGRDHDWRCRHRWVLLPGCENGAGGLSPARAVECLDRRDHFSPAHALFTPSLNVFRSEAVSLPWATSWSIAPMPRPP